MELQLFEDFILCGVHYLSEDVSCTLMSNFNIYSNNTSRHLGGVYSINRGVVTEDSSFFSLNFAVNYAGTIYIRNSGELNILNSLFSGEGTNVWCGSIYLCENSIILVINSSFENCKGRSGGVFYFEDHYNVTIFQSYFTGNEPYEGGVAIIDSSNNEFNLISCIFMNTPVQNSLFSLSSAYGNIKFSSIISINVNCTFFDLINSVAYIENSNYSEQYCQTSTKGCICSIQDSSISLKNVQITNITLNTEGSLFYSYNGLSLYLENIAVSLLGGISDCSCGNLMYSTMEIINSSFWSFEAT